MISSVLVANRGEIAVRIIRTCREMGIRTVAVHSTADRDAAHTRLADERVHIGPAPARRSYLNPAAILAAAQHTGVEAVHPGYGFLSEDPDFAEICVDHGLIFVGPPAPVLADLGDKARAREIASKAGLPVLPGGGTAVEDVERARRTADDIGHPVIVKAAAGGGGRGMAVVDRPEDFSRVFEETRATARNLFGDPRLYVERFLPAARHIEVQVLVDAYGTGVHLGARDCSIQRRRQKLLEETPPPGLPADLIERMGAAALRAALAVGYEGAATYEFLVDEDGAFYFMEVNCRIQVEHPITEMVTGIDIVREQLAIASGRPLPESILRSAPRGVAIECRINTEDPVRGFLPTAGALTDFQAPGGPFVRVDTHAEPGMTVTADYDPLLAKIIVWGPDRETAIDRMGRALHETRVAGAGLSTTRDFLAEVLTDPCYRHAAHTTAFVDDRAHRRSE
ncbi:ATP-grasp domain-containing protein [Actinoallomurus purpureus]|uniref:acetyl-CoA carboxylase biotin carboxylase subunit n=1 Tax=Actinoallomurus purpureus TaxID=478114 RepID=UPI002092998F|nr:biotin carboxylase N-terminal domain-containing protein [Actinoallomurus purpureus]MCO6008409.1 ATP-grasp domain-containing protein [Actinoallomurus purpureus]